MVQNTTNLARDLGELLKEDSDVPAFKTALGLRNAYRDCQLIGGTVHKVPNAKAARAEVNALADEVMELLGVEVPA
jgi:chromosome partitioning protein